MLALLIIGAVVCAIGLVVVFVGIGCDFDSAALFAGAVAFVAGLALLMTMVVMMSDHNADTYRRNCEQLGGTPHIFRDGKICVKDSAVLNP